MVSLKCKMCGGNVVVQDNSGLGTCENCGNTITIPSISDEQKANLFNRANHFRRQGEFDKALSAYEHILSEDDSVAEAHWGVILCRYGVDYVEDPDSHKLIPTCHRASFDSIFTDLDYQRAVQCADPMAAELYQAEGKQIDEIQKGILAISKTEQPFDIFISYKETTSGGTRTKDSVLAQDLYVRLTKEGYRVFFSRITLEDKIGQQYEPYIFSALNSAKVMLVVGTDRDNFNEPWVRNEWGRYLALLKKDSGRLLIPCYRDMDVYDLPEELTIFQCQDMGKIGFEQDLLHGIRKIIPNEKNEPTTANESKVSSADIDPLLRRAKLFAEGSEWKNASAYYDKALDLYPECAEAYIGKLCVELCCSDETQIVDAFAKRIQQDVDNLETANQLKGIDTRNNYILALRFADSQQRERLKQYANMITEAIAEGRARKKAAYATTFTQLESGTEHAKNELNDMEQAIKLLEVRIQDNTNRISSLPKLEKPRKYNIGTGCLIWVVLFIIFGIIFTHVAVSDAVGIIITYGVPTLIAALVTSQSSKKTQSYEKAIAEQEQLRSQIQTVIDEDTKSLGEHRTKMFELNQLIIAYQAKIRQLIPLSKEY